MEDVPGLGLLVVALGCLGVGLIGVHLHGEELLGVHRDDLNRGIVGKVADELVVVLGDELIEARAVERAALDRGTDVGVSRDVKCLAIVDVVAMLEAASLGDAGSAPDGGDVGGLEQNGTHAASFPLVPARARQH